MQFHGQSLKGNKLDLIFQQDVTGIPPSKSHGLYKGRGSGLQIICTFQDRHQKPHWSLLPHSEALFPCVFGQVENKKSHYLFRGNFLHSKSAGGNSAVLQRVQKGKNRCGVQLIHVDTSCLMNAQREQCSKIYSDWWIRPVGIEGMSYKTRQVRKSYSDDG